MSNVQKKKFAIAELIAGLDVTVIGDATTVIQGVATLENAQPGHIAFLTNPLYKKYLERTQASAVILTSEDASHCNAIKIISRDPYYTYAKMAAYFVVKPVLTYAIHPSAVMNDDCEIANGVTVGPNTVLGKGVKLGRNVSIGANCFIGDYSIIGDDSILHANVTLYHDIEIGKEVIINSGTVIGGDGFGIAKHAGSWHKIPQLGKVIIKDNVEIGVNCAIDRGAIEDTVIEQGVKLDNLIQIGHNVRIGEHTAIAGCVGIAGSTNIGRNCLLGGGAGISGHLEIADDVMITGMSVITKSIREPGIYSSGVGGVVTNKEWRKNSARLHQLEQLTKRVKTLELVIKELTESNEP